QTLPIRIGGIALLVVGAIALVAEVFATTHGVLGAGGVLSFILGLIWVIDPAQIREGVSPMVYVPAGIFLAGVAFMIAWFASRTRARAQEALATMKGGGLAGLQGYVGRVDAPGKLLIRGEIWDYVSEEPVGVGDIVEVLGVQGLKAVVRPRKSRS